MLYFIQRTSIHSTLQSVIKSASVALLGSTQDIYYKNICSIELSTLFLINCSYQNLSEFTEDDGGSKIIETAGWDGLNLAVLFIKTSLLLWWIIAALLRL